MSGLGLPGLAVFQKKEPVPTPGPPGPPFQLTSAAEGLSVDPVSGKIVLGTDGTYGTPDIFTGLRQLEVSNQILLLVDTTSGGPGQGSSNELGSDRILIASPSGGISLQAIFTDVALQFVLIDFINQTPTLVLSTGVNDLSFINQNGVLETSVSALANGTREDFVNERMILFDLGAADNGRMLQIPGNLSLATDFTVAGLDFPNTLAFSSSDISTALAIGALPGDMVFLGIDPASVLPNSCFTAWVSAADTVTIRFNNYSAAPLDPAAGDFKISVVKLT